MVDTRNPFLIVIAVVLGGIIHAAMYGPQGAYIVEQFPTRVRYAGASVAYTAAGIVGAGIAPLIFVALLRAYQTTTTISFYVIASLGVTCIVLFMARETAKAPLQE